MPKNSRNRMKNSAPSAGPRKLRMPPITTIASSSPENATEIGSAEVMRFWNKQQYAGKPGDPGGQHEGGELVAVGGIAEEARALLVLADRHQHGADGRIMEAPQQDQHQEGDGGDEPVVVRGGFQIDAEQRRPGDAAEAVLAAGDVGPAERDRIQHRRQRQRQQREIHAAPAQDQEAEGEGHGHHDRTFRRWRDRRTSPASGCAGSAPPHRRRGRTRRHGRTRPGRYARPGCSAPCRPARR